MILFALMPIDLPLPYKLKFHTIFMIWHPLWDGACRLCISVHLNFYDLSGNTQPQADVVPLSRISMRCQSFQASTLFEGIVQFPRPSEQWQMICHIGRFGSHSYSVSFYQRDYGEIVMVWTKSWFFKSLTVLISTDSALALVNRGVKTWPKWRVGALRFRYSKRTVREFWDNEEKQRG